MDEFLDKLLSDFLFFSGSNSGPILGSKWAKKRQDAPKKDFKSLKVPKSSIFKKCGFPMGKLYFLSFGSSQDEHKMLMMALKRHLKSFKTPRTFFPKINLNNSICWISVGTHWASRMGAKT